jgi:hypothetical protein
VFDASSHTLDQLRAQLGNEGFDQEVARGAAMSLEEALAFMRAATESLLND